MWRRLALKKMRVCADSSEPWRPFPSPQSSRNRSRLPRNTIGFCSMPPIPVVDKQGAYVRKSRPKLIGIRRSEACSFVRVELASDR